MREPLNLASQRFRNERLPGLLFGVGCVALLLLSAAHLAAIRRLLPGQSSKLRQEVSDLEAEVTRLRTESAQLRGGPQPEKARVEEWQLVKDLVDERVFRWTQLFAHLAKTLPSDVRLSAITPSVRKGVVSLDIEADVKSLDSGLAFIQRLEEQPEFQDVFPKSVASSPVGGGQRFTYGMLYLPEADAPAAAGAAR